MNTNPIIDIDSTFIKAVRAYSFISKSDTSIPDEDIKTIAVNDVYPRILTRVALTTDKNGIPIFGGIGNSKDYGVQYLKSVEVLNMLPYSLGLRRVAIALTASALLRVIPLKSDVSLIDAAESIEKGAMGDLDKLVGVLANDTKTISSLQTMESTHKTSYKALLISQDIDEKTIPIGAFNKILDTVAIYKGANTYCHAIIPDGQIGICVITLSCQIKQAVLRDAFIVQHGATSTDLATLISQSINELNIELGTGIIASPNKGVPELIKIPISPSRLYPNSNIDRNLQLYIELTPAIDVVEIVSQVLSPVRDKEVLTVDMFTVPSKLINKPSLTVHDLINLSRLGVRGIKGIVFGTELKYSELTNKGPHSTIVEIDKGTLITKQERDIVDPQTSTSSNSNTTKQEGLILDTFHFRLSKNYTTLEPASIKIRVNTQPSTLETNIWTYEFSGGSLDDLVVGLLDSIFINSRPSCIVGAITSPYSLQIVPHLITNDETRIVIDISNLPIGVEVSTGTDRLYITPYKGGTRSINVPSIRMSASEMSKKVDNIMKSTPTSLGSAGRSIINHQGVSDKLIGVREKLRSMEQCGGGGRGSNNNRSSRCNQGVEHHQVHYYTLNDVIDIYKNGYF